MRRLVQACSRSWTLRDARAQSPARVDRLDRPCRRIRIRRSRTDEDNPDGIPTRRGSGRLLRECAATRWRLAQSDERSRPQVEGIVRSMPQVRDTIAVIGFSLLDGFAASNSALLVAQLKPFAERTGPDDSAQAVIGGCRRTADPRGRCSAVQSSAGGGPVDNRRLPIPARGRRGSRPGCTWERRAGSRRCRQAESAAGGRLLVLPRQFAVQAELARRRP